MDYRALSSGQTLFGLTTDTLLLSVFYPRVKIPDLLVNELFPGYQVLPSFLKICDPFVNGYFAGFLSCLYNSKPGQK